MVHYIDSPFEFRSLLRIKQLRYFEIIYQFYLIDIFHCLLQYQFLWQYLATPWKALILKLLLL